jgi:hypothetical protein
MLHWTLSHSNRFTGAMDYIARQLDTQPFESGRASIGGIEEQHLNGKLAANASHAYAPRLGEKLPIDNK